jgi:hypothetical protein
MCLLVANLAQSGAAASVARNVLRDPLPDVAVKPRPSQDGDIRPGSLFVRFVISCPFDLARTKLGRMFRSKGIRRRGTSGDVKRLWTASKTGGSQHCRLKQEKNPRSSGWGVSNGFTAAGRTLSQTAVDPKALRGWTRVVPRLLAKCLLEPSRRDLHLPS